MKKNGRKELAVYVFYYGDYKQNSALVWWVDIVTT